MKYYDINGGFFEKNTCQDDFLEKLYESFLGRIALKVLVSPFVSEIGGWFLKTPFSKAMIKPFIKKNNIDMSVYEDKKYKSYNDFFTRKIKKDARTFDYDKKTIISPSDGKVSCYELDENAVFKIKGGSYSLKSLLKCCNLAEKFQGGYAFVIRLTVDDYHRYCYVCDGIKTADRHINGVYHTVNPIAFSHCRVFKENTREYTTIKSAEFGDVIQMEVGATMVGRISNRHKGRCEVKKGEEKGRFEFGGSTIVVFVGKDKIKRPDTLLLRTKEGAETIIKQGMILCEKS